MIETGILALTDKYDPAGIVCLAAIPVLIIAFIPFSKGLIAGSGTNCIAFFIFVLWLAGPDAKVSDSVVPTGGDCGYITNESQTKWIKKPSGAYLDHDGAVFFILDGPNGSALGATSLFIPAEEANAIRAKNIAKGVYEHRFKDEDYYIYDEVYPTVNVSVEHGGNGIPQWLYHPACLVYITGFFALPALGLGAVISRKL